MRWTPSPVPSIRCTPRSSRPSRWSTTWSGYQTEWATDILFKDPRSLAGIYPPLVSHAIEHFKISDVMRFLGGKVHGNFTGEIITSFKDRPEGVRVKHWVRGNSIKMYDKAGSVLRVETTIARTNDFKVFRRARDNPKSKLDWRPLPKGVADLHRRAQPPCGHLLTAALQATRRANIKDLLIAA